MSILSHRGFSLAKSGLTDSELRALRKELTVSPFVPGQPPGAPRVQFPVFKESPSRIYLPKFYGLAAYGPPDDDRTNSGAEISAHFAGDLREAQQEPVRAFLDACDDPLRRGGVLSLGCAAGKTVIALHCVSRLRRKTLIVVHKSFLLDQWRERIQQFLPSATVSIVKAQVTDVSGDIVIASLQSLAAKDYPSDLFADIGFMVVDECHRISTECFSRALLKVSPRYTLGLSATVTRVDGMHKVIFWWLGSVCFSKERDREVVQVRRVHYAHSDDAYSRELFLSNGKLNTACMINNICKFANRTQMVVQQIVAVLTENPGRRVLVLCDRIAMLRDLAEALNVCGIDNGFYIGGLKQAVLDASALKTVVLATFCMSSEGLDIKGLDTLVMCSPRSNIQQAVGRILRAEQHCRNTVPLIIDVNDDFSVFTAQSKKRLAFYKKNAYRVVDVHTGESKAATAAASPVEAQEEQYLFVDD